MSVKVPQEVLTDRWAWEPQLSFNPFFYDAQMREWVGQGHTELDSLYNFQLIVSACLTSIPFYWVHPCFFLCLLQSVLEGWVKTEPLAYCCSWSCEIVLKQLPQLHCELMLSWTNTFWVSGYFLHWIDNSFYTQQVLNTAALQEQRRTDRAIGLWESDLDLNPDSTM